MLFCYVPVIWECYDLSVIFCYVPVIWECYDLSVILLCSSDLGAITEIKELQKQRGRQKGVSLASLALGKKIQKSEQIENVNI